MADITPFPVDLDAEVISLDGNWYTRDDLAQRIKGMLDKGDFAIARYSAALEQLTSAIRSVRTLAFRATPELADAVNLLANRGGVTVGHVLREAVIAVVKAERLEVTARVAVPSGKPPPPPPGQRAVQPVEAQAASAHGPVELTNRKVPI